MGKPYTPGKYFTGVPCKRGHVAERLQYNGQCVECKKQSDRKSNRIATKKYQLAVNYNLTVEDVERMHLKQAGLCAICGGKLKPRHGTQVDHCHETGKVRGLLCNHCNRLLGCARDNPRILENATNYIYRSRYGTNRIQVR